jgi:tetratricopeptide (TPR) repeat protein
LGSTEGWSLPPCSGNDSSTWTNCFGTLTYPDGSKYVGGWKDGYKHGQGTYTFADGRVWIGLWSDGGFVSGKEYAAGEAPPAPPVAAKAPEPSPPPDQSSGRRGDQLDMIIGLVAMMIGLVVIIRRIRRRIRKKKKYTEEKEEIWRNFNLGSRYYDGDPSNVVDGVAQDYEQALKYFHKAADNEKGHEGYAESSSSCKLGLMYKSGQGVAKDYSRALEYFCKAAKWGNSDADYNLGVMYESGEGVAQDDAEALRWYRRAVVCHHALAQIALSRMGAGVEARAEASPNKTFIVTYRSTKKGGLIKGHSKMQAAFASFDKTEEIEAKTKKEAKEKFKNMNKGILSPQTIVSIEEK